MKQKKVSLVIAIVFLLTLAFNVFDTENIKVFAAENTVKADPQIYGESAITVDMETGEILYEKGIDNKMYPASTTKLLTALLLAKNKNKSDKLTYTQGAKNQPASSLNESIQPIDVGETMSSEEAMDGLLLFSANDVAYMIADSVGKDEKDFANMMNEEISKLGLKNTHFVTPNGLHDPNHYTTCYELSIIAENAFKNDWVRETMGKQKSTIKTSKGTTFSIENTNKLLGKDGCIGGKTGYTDDAGRCLATVYEREGRKILGIVLKSIFNENDTAVFEDMKKIINWSYELNPVTLHSKDSVLINKEIKYKPLGFIGPEKSINIPIIVKEDINYYENEVNKNELKEDFNIADIDLSSLKSDNPIGTLTVKERNVSKDYSLYADVPDGFLFKNNLPIYEATIVIVLVVLGVITFIIRMIMDKKNKKKIDLKL